MVNVLVVGVWWGVWVDSGSERENTCCRCDVLNDQGFLYIPLLTHNQVQGKRIVFEGHNGTARQGDYADLQPDGPCIVERLLERLR